MYLAGARLWVPSLAAQSINQLISGSFSKGDAAESIFGDTKSSSTLERELDTRLA